MRKYYGELANETNWEKRHHVITVEALNIKEAFTKICNAKATDEDIYQISRDFEDCSCPQPIYDFWNQFSLDDDSTVTTWSKLNEI